MSFVWLAFAFICGALPFSVWIGRYGLGVDIRNYGDGNPGATNVLRAGGKLWYAFAMLADISKGAVPTGLAAQVAGLDGWLLACVGLMPSLGHAFSPFLNWRGGKALASAFGVWIGLTLWEISIPALVLLSLWAVLIRPSGWAVMLTMPCLAIAIWLIDPNPIWFAVVGGQTLLFLFKHWSELHQRPSAGRLLAQSNG